MCWGSLAQCTTFCGWSLLRSRSSPRWLRKRRQAPQMVHCAQEPSIYWRITLVPCVPCVPFVSFVPFGFLASVALPSLPVAVPQMLSGEGGPVKPGQTRSNPVKLTRTMSQPPPPAPGSHRRYHILWLHWHNAQPNVVFLNPLYVRVAAASRRFPHPQLPATAAGRGCHAKDGGQATRNSPIVSGQTRSNPVKPSQSKKVGLTAQFGWRNGKAALARAHSKAASRPRTPSAKCRGVRNGSSALAAKQAHSGEVAAKRPIRLRRHYKLP